MKVSKKDAQAMKCLGGKLKIVASDPDPKALQDLNKEYNCAGCSKVKLCDKLIGAILVSGD